VKRGRVSDPPETYRKKETLSKGRSTKFRRESGEKKIPCLSGRPSRFSPSTTAKLAGRLKFLTCPREIEQSMKECTAIEAINGSNTKRNCQHNWGGKTGGVLWGQRRTKNTKCKRYRTHRKREVYLLRYMQGTETSEKKKKTKTRLETTIWKGKKINAQLSLRK